jgi:hypothetical protein
MVKRTLLLAMGLAGLLTLPAYKSDTHKEKWVSLFDGKTLTGWKAAENPATFSVQDGAIVVAGPRAHLFYEGPVNNHDFKNFEWKADIKTLPGSNSGMFIHTAYQENGWPKQGYEIQVNQTHTDWRKTGSVYGLQDVKETFVKDGEWYNERIVVRGKTIQILINDKVINTYTEPENTDKAGSGTIAIQGHDPKSTVYYKNIEIMPLPN